MRTPFRARTVTGMLALMFLLVVLSGTAAESKDASPVNLDTPLAAGGPNPVAIHGALSVSGSKIVDANGNPTQLKGMSLFWSQWGGSFYNETAVANTRDYWNASVIRAAMGVEMGGYLENPADEKAKVKAVVDAAVKSGMYVIIDWHDHHAESHGAQAAAFFAEMASLYKNTPNVLFEIYNEPLDTDSWSKVKAYAEPVVKAIRDAGAANIIIVGSPHWSQDVNSAAADPIAGYDNIAYSLHFYAYSHTQWLRERADAAMKGSKKQTPIALFVTEWGTCDASGNGNFTAAESDRWIKWMDENDVSWCNWSLNTKAETASALIPGAGSSGPWSSSSLTVSGKYVVEKMRSGGNFKR